jgi:hypothetical protein
MTIRAIDEVSDTGTARVADVLGFQTDISLHANGTSPPRSLNGVGHEHRSDQGHAHPRLQNGAVVQSQPLGARRPVNDPLAGMSPWQIFQRCIWISDEDANTKISLLCISRYMDKDLRASSMSYAQIARDCGFSEATAKRCAKAVANTWLKIGARVDTSPARGTRISTTAPSRRGARMN